MFLQIVTFSLQTDGSGRLVLTKEKRSVYCRTLSVLAFGLVIGSLCNFVNISDIKAGLLNDIYKLKTRQEFGFLMQY